MAQEVGAGVADDLDAFLVLGGDDAHRSIVVDGVARIVKHPVDLAGDACARKARADALSYFKNGNRMVKFLDRAIGKSDFRHVQNPDAYSHLRAPVKVK